MDLIREHFDKVIKYSQNFSADIDTERLFYNWDTNKRILRDRFLQGKLIYTHPEKISFELDIDAKAERQTSFIEYAINVLGTSYNDFITYLMETSPSDFFKNITSKEFHMADGKSIPKGMKIVKSFKYFISDARLLEDIQNKASEIIQENKIEGYLNFSIHPLDYLSISENAYNWRSCHALDGEYRGGNLSYMTDCSTMICYLSSGTDVKLPRFPDDVPWNNKKWRCLLFFDNCYDVVFAGRQYPFFSPGALEIVRQVFYDNLIQEEDIGWWGMKKLQWSHWHNDYIKEFHYNEFDEEDGPSQITQQSCGVINGKIFNLYDVIHEEHNTLNYNDLLRSTCYEYPYYMFKKKYDNNFSLNIGKEVYCLKCGIKPIVNTHSMFCPDCMCIYGEELDSDEYPICSVCGNRYYGPEGYFIGEEYVCESCYHTQAFRCEECWGNYFNDEKHWVEELKRFLCDDCYNEYLEKKGE